MSTYIMNPDDWVASLKCLDPGKEEWFIVAGEPSLKEDELGFLSLLRIFWGIFSFFLLVLSAFRDLFVGLQQIHGLPLICL